MCVQARKIDVKNPHAYSLYLCHERRWSFFGTTSQNERKKKQKYVIVKIIATTVKKVVSAKSLYVSILNLVQKRYYFFLVAIDGWKPVKQFYRIVI